jgi:hypothetical protein
MSLKRRNNDTTMRAFCIDFISIEIPTPVVFSILRLSAVNPPSARCSGWGRVLFEACRFKKRPIQIAYDKNLLV